MVRVMDCVPEIPLIECVSFYQRTLCSVQLGYLVIDLSRSLYVSVCSTRRDIQSY